MAIGGLELNYDVLPIRFAAAKQIVLCTHFHFVQFRKVNIDEWVSVGLNAHIKRQKWSARIYWSKQMIAVNKFSVCIYTFAQSLARTGTHPTDMTMDFKHIWIKFDKFQIVRVCGGPIERIPHQFELWKWNALVERWMTRAQKVVRTVKLLIKI